MAQKRQAERRRKSQQCHELTRLSKFVTVLFCHFTAKCLPGWALFVVRHQTCEKCIRTPSIPLWQVQLGSFFNRMCHQRPHKPLLKTNGGGGWNNPKEAPLGKHYEQGYISASHLNCLHLDLMKAFYHPLKAALTPGTNTFRACVLKVNVVKKGWGKDKETPPKKLCKKKKKQWCKDAALSVGGLQ